MSTPLDWENRPQQFPEPVTQEDVEDELAEMFRCLGDMAGAMNQYVIDIAEEDLAAQRAETERVLKTWGVQ